MYRSTNSLRRLHRFLGLMAMMMGIGLGTSIEGMGQPSIVALPTSETALLGRFAHGPLHWPTTVNATEFAAIFASDNPSDWPAEIQGQQFFAHGGTSLHVVRVAESGSLAAALTGRASDQSGCHALVSLSNLRVLIAPELTHVAPADFPALLTACRTVLEPARAFLILDPPSGLTSAMAAVEWLQSTLPSNISDAAIYFPYLEILVQEKPHLVGPSGAMAAIYAQNDAREGIWKSPAGLDLLLQAQDLSLALSTSDLDLLNLNHICAIRSLPGVGIVPWGARTLDRSNVDNRYIAVVRTRDWVAASVSRSLAFAAVEDNNTTLWNQMRSITEAFLLSLYRQGALLGNKPEEAFFVRCDTTTTTAADIAAHRVNLLYGLAMIRPAEFDISQISSATWNPSRPPPATTLHGRVLAGELHLTYPTFPGLNHGLEDTPALLPNSWKPVESLTPGDGSWRRVKLPLKEKARFLQVRTEWIR